MKNFTLIPNELFEANHVSSTARFLFSILLKYCGQKDYCFPSQDTLAKSLKLSTRQVRSYITELEESNLIIKQRRGFNKSNIYYINKEALTDRKSTSSQLSSIIPISEGRVLPTNNTYIKEESNNKRVALEKMRAELKRKGILK